MRNLFVQFVCLLVILESTSELNLAAKLPLFSVMSDSSFVWSDTHGTDFVQQISSAYDVTVHWHRNLFLAKFSLESWLNYLLLMERVRL